jgi:hypothetical protein
MLMVVSGFKWMLVDVIEWKAKNQPSRIKCNVSSNITEMLLTKLKPLII